MGHIFISYSHKDTTYARGLADHLKIMGFDIWIDERLDYGSQWPHEIQRQLDSCDAFILIMTLVLLLRIGCRVNCSAPSAS